MSPEPQQGHTVSSRMRARVSLRFVVSAGAVLLIAATALAMGIVEDRSTRRLLTAEIHNRLRLEARSLGLMSADALLGDYPELVLQPIVSDMLADAPELAFVYVVDHEGKLRAHPDSRMLGTELDLPEDLAATGAMPGDELHTGAEAIVAFSPAGQEGGARLGTAIVGLDHGYLADRIAEARRAKAATVFALMAAGIGGALVLMTWVMRPVRIVHRGLERIGRGDLDSPIQLDDWTELGQLADTVDNMAARLKDAQAELVDKERLSYEMELAHRIQQSLLPAADQKFGSFHILGAQQSAAEVGGDYYDVFALPGDRIGLVVADVSGKGLAGCLATSMLAAFVRVYREQHGSPSALLAAVEAQLEATLPRGTFVTMFYGILDPASHELTFASAGHSPTIVYRANDQRVEWLNPRGGPLALTRARRSRQREDQTVQLARGDLVVQYTDGINEAFNGTGEELFGFDKLEHVVRSHAGSGPTAVMRGVRGAVDGWSAGQPASDDETLLIVGCDLPDAPVDSPETASEVEEPDLRAMLDEALVRGVSLSVPVDLRRLHLIREWTQQCPIIRRLNRTQINVVNVLLHEVCSNIIEHGGCPENSDIELYWLPERAAADIDDATLDHQAAARSLTRGTFLIADRGSPFDTGVATPDADRLSRARRSGRGLGLPIIRRVASVIRHEPGTEAGNLTLLRFASGEALLAGGSTE